MPRARTSGRTTGLCWVVALKLTPDEGKSLRAAAARAGVPPSTFARLAALLVAADRGLTVEIGRAARAARAEAEG